MQPCVRFHLFLSSSRGSRCGSGDRNSSSSCSTNSGGAVVGAVVVGGAVVGGEGYGVFKMVITNLCFCVSAEE